MNINTVPLATDFANLLAARRLFSVREHNMKPIMVVSVWRAG